MGVEGDSLDTDDTEDADSILIRDNLRNLRRFEYFNYSLLID